jgi:DNA repair photolyase
MRKTEIHCNSALNKLKRKIPYEWDLNIYRGCQHGCVYCYAIYSHDYLGTASYFNDIYIKTNIVEELEKELSHPSWQRSVINIGGVTDSYQPLESEYQFMPDILKLLIKYKTPAIISTKSELVLRDYDLIDKLSQITYVNIAETITVLNESIRKVIEPNGAESKRRFEVLRAFRKTNCSVGLHLMPVIPYLSDSKENLEQIFSLAKDVDVHYLLPGTLYLRGKSRGSFFNCIKENFPDQYQALLSLYKTGGADKDYKEKLYQTINSLRVKYGVSPSYSKVMKDKMHKD